MSWYATSRVICYLRGTLTFSEEMGNGKGVAKVELGGEGGGGLRSGSKVNKLINEE